MLDLPTHLAGSCLKMYTEGPERKYKEMLLLSSNAQYKLTILLLCCTAVLAGLGGLSLQAVRREDCMPWFYVFGFVTTIEIHKVKQCVCLCDVSLSSRCS